MNWKRGLLLVLASSLLVSLIWIPAGAAGQAQVVDDEPQLVIAGNGWGTGETMDPALDYETIGTQLLLQIYDTLILPPRDSTGEYIPNLAAGWNISADGRTYTFYIRKGMFFTNGAMLTPEDVAYTFRRGLLMGGGFSPQWLLFEPLLGSTSYKDISDLVDSSGSLMDDRAALKNAPSYKLVGACNKVFQAVTYNDAAGTVTFHLAQPWKPFLETLTGAWGGILDKTWVITNGGWDGSCATWQNFYATQPSDSPIASITNGTGPYIFTSVDENGNVRLDRKPDYWRKEPMWPGGPVGEAFYKSVLIENIPDSAVRKDMLLNGEAQLASIDVAYRDELDEQVLFNHPDSSMEGVLQNTAGVLRRYPGVVSSSSDLMFNYKIVKSSKYTGSGHFGEGTPSNFFEDIHVRKAFNYAFDWETWIADAYGGQAIQRRGVIPKGFTGYSDSQPAYSMNLALAKHEFEEAWNGKVANQGFTMTIAYNENNTARQAACEILKANIESISPNYHVNILELPWGEYLEDYRGRLLPLGFAGWMADINHPHNFAAPYLTRGGAYAGWQSLTPALLNLFEPKVKECVALPLGQAQSCYEELQNMTYENAVNVWGVQPGMVNYTRAELQGYYRRLTGEIYYYTLSQTPLPTIGAYTAGEGMSLSFSDPRGSTGEVQVPADAFAADVNLVITPGKPIGEMASGFRFGELAFEITPYDLDGVRLSPPFDPGSPVIVTIHYDENDLAGVREETLRLLYWTGTTWEDGSCGEQIVDTATNTLTVPLCHFSAFALGGFPIRYLPFIVRD